jgi:hypothetical protein
MRRAPLESISGRFWALDVESSSDDESPIGMPMAALRSTACHSLSPDPCRLLLVSSDGKEERRRKKMEQQRYGSNVLESLSDGEDDGTMARAGDQKSDDPQVRAFWRSNLNIPVLEPSSVPLGNIIEAKEWITVCRRRRRGGPSPALSPAKAGRRRRSSFNFNNGRETNVSGRKRSGLAQSIESPHRWRTDACNQWDGGAPYRQNFHHGVLDAC